MRIPKNLKKKLLKMHWGIAGHAAVEICRWTKKHLRNEGSCYKRKFYGIDTNRCAEIAPTPIWCEHNCVYCWRPMEFMKSKVEGESMEPKEMIEGLIKERRRLLSGFKGFERVDKEKFHDAYYLFPNHWAISLAGEPTLYDKLDQLIKLLKENKEVRSIFVVSNGEEPQVLKRLNERNLLPVQLYISVNAPNERLYRRIANPVLSDGWERLNKTLSELKKLNTRTVIRFTLIKKINDSLKLLNEYAELFESTQSDFLEIKAYMFVGYSQRRLSFDNMPLHEEVVEFAKKLEEQLPSYEIINQHKPSRIVLMKNNKSKVSNLIFFNDPKYEEVDEITSEWRIYTLLKKYRKARMILDEYGFDSWDKDWLTLKEQAKELRINAKKIVKKINDFIRKEYLRDKRNC